MMFSWQKWLKVLLWISSSQQDNIIMSCVSCVLCLCLLILSIMFMSHFLVENNRIFYDNNRRIIGTFFKN